MLNGARILVAEDEPLIAMELGQTIVDAGGVVAASARSQLEALAHAEHGEIDAAVLDIRLRDGSTFAVAALLAGRGIPFLFCTADTGDRTQFAAWPGVPVVAKPHVPAVIIDTLVRLIQNQG